jgi:formate C-acetyltransferase
VIVGIQTDKPFRRAIMPTGGYKMVEDGLKAAGFEIDPAVRETFTKYRKTHNDAVFDLYTPEIRACRKSSIITGLPDAYGRGRIIGDYRRVASVWRGSLDRGEEGGADADRRALADGASDAVAHGHGRPDFARSATSRRWRRRTDSTSDDPQANACEAVQWTYFGYLGAIKEMNGAAMSVGRVSTFFDIYIERDLAEKTLTEDEAQELIDQLVVKLRIVRFLRTPAYDALFSGDPYWATEVIGGMGAGWPHARLTDELPLLAHAQESRLRARAKSHGSLVEAPAGTIQALLHRDEY